MVVEYAPEGDRKRWLVRTVLVLIVVAAGAAVAAVATSSGGSRGATAIRPVSASARAERIGSGTGGAGHLSTLPPGASLPSDAVCAARVRPAPEIRPKNVTFNQTRGHPTPATADPSQPRFTRVTGDFVGTTDEIIQWAACKWGIDEDVVRAQVAKESYWTQTNLGDFTTDPANCIPGHPIGADGRPGQCPESVGLMQVRYPYFRNVISDAEASSAYNLDISYAIWRACYEGEETWLNTVDRGRQYGPGDQWGCIGRWFSGRWYTQPSNEYMAAVQDWYEQRIWESPSFRGFSG